MAIEKLHTTLLTPFGCSPFADDYVAMLQKQIEDYGSEGSSGVGTAAPVLTEISEDIYRAWHMNAKKVHLKRYYKTENGDGSGQASFEEEQDTVPHVTDRSGLVYYRWAESFVNPNMFYTEQDTRIILGTSIKSLIDTVVDYSLAPSLSVFPVRFREDELKFYAYYTRIRSVQAEMYPALWRTEQAGGPSTQSIAVEDEIEILTATRFKTAQTFLAGASVSPYASGTRHEGGVDWTITETFY